MPRKPREITLRVMIKLVPHPDPERALSLIAGLVLDRVLEEVALRKGGSDCEDITLSMRKRH